MKKRISLLLVVAMLISVFALFPATSTAVSEIIGDADLNGSVEAADASAVLRHVVGIDTLTGQALLNADANQNGSVDSQDASVILRYIVGIISSLPPTGEVIVTPPVTNTPKPTPTPTPTPNANLGDVDLNGDVQAADASAILRHVVKIIELSEASLANGDVTFDNSVDAADAARILRYVVKIITDLNVWPDPTAIPTLAPTPSPTPVPLNNDGIPAAGNSGLVVPNDDPNY
ncbi:MAG: dockerin type I repeat-containing protein, partial [Clostridia bacterium]|nr:dockerin type I repeat-containing protein [Clostridia bacterium]